ncbi:MAG TPA: hypothetical protein VKA64_01445 [Gammaproteobacteria bacterium]|nr:hypothetical protein [Gammaproteobacteria bacterium]
MRWTIAALVAALAWPVLAAAEDVEAVMLLYQRQDGGGPAYPSRFLVTPEYMRIDSGETEGDYVLFDRKKGVIHSVTHQDGSVLEIRPHEVAVEAPVELNLSQERTDQGDMPPVGGTVPERHLLRANDRRCYEVVAVPGLLEAAVEARREYRRVLAGEHARGVNALPADMQDVCNLATHTFAPVRHLAYGLPIQERGHDGFSRTLMDYDRAVEVDAALFTLPEGYVHYAPGETRERQ